LVVVKATPDEKFFGKDYVDMQYGRMRRFVVGEDDFFRAGFTRLTKKESGKSQMRPMWMDEFFVGLRGRGRIVCRTQPDYDHDEVYEISPQEAIFMGRGTIRRFECVSKVPWIIFYCAVPAASKGLGVRVFPQPDYDRNRDQNALGHRAKNLWS
jgi:mannose-6-phosphate isomerase-like protein (cupin superfamily)